MDRDIDKPTRLGRQIGRIKSQRSKIDQLISKVKSTNAGYKTSVQLNKSLRAFQFGKQRVVSRLFWGRGNFYKNLSHVLMISITVLVTITGVIVRISSLTNAERAPLQVGSAISGTDDLLQQGGSIDTVLINSSDSVLSVAWREHVVAEGESLDDLIEQYNVSKQTIQSANSKTYPPLFLSDHIETGWVLRIPDINGIVHEVRQGETIDNIVQRYANEGNREANRFNIIEFNALVEPYTLEAGQLLFIPDGNTNPLTSDEDIDLSLLTNAFVDPLSHPECAGYAFSRGFTSYHNGVDLAKSTGCTIVAVADGFVEYAGWASQGQGYMVRINHGGGIKTEYFHGNGVYWVKAGDIVDQNQPIMHMGSTGYSTGTHLHFILWKNNVAINPRPYVPYIGAY